MRYEPECALGTLPKLLAARPGPARLLDLVERLLGRGDAGAHAH